MNEEILEIEYHILKESVQKEQVHPYNPISSEYYDSGVAYVEKKQQPDVVTITEWVLGQTRLLNEKRSSAEKAEFRYNCKLGKYLSEEEE